MRQHEWRTDWLSFVEYVSREIDGGADSDELSRELESEEVRWTGKVAKLRLDSQYARGVAVAMEPVRRKLANASAQWYRT